MVKYIADVIQKIISEITEHRAASQQFSLDSINFRDFIDSEMEYDLKTINTDLDFRTNNSIDDYNRDLFYILKANKNQFYIDHCHLDGHFRV